MAWPPPRNVVPERKLFAWVLFWLVMAGYLAYCILVVLFVSYLSRFMRLVQHLLHRIQQEIGGIRGKSSFRARQVEVSGDLTRT